MNVDLPMTDEDLKYEIIKELKKMYGEKSSQYLLQNKEKLDLILQNIKNARQEMLKMETGSEPDDNLTKEFFRKYEKEGFFSAFSGLFNVFV